MSTDLDEKQGEIKVESPKLELIVAEENKDQVIETGSNDYTQCLGRLKRTLSKKCPECHRPLQLRARSEKQMLRGEEIVIEVDYIVCSANCGYEDETEQRKRKLTHDKTTLRKEDLEIGRDQRRGKHGKYSERSAVHRQHGKSDQGDFRRGHRRGS